METPAPAIEPRYPFGDTVPASGTPLQVAPGILWHRMPLPFALDHINLWLLQDDAQWLAIDSGIDSDATRNAWQQLQRSGHVPSRVLATHCHPDHIGLAHWLCASHNAPLLCSAAEYAYARLMSAAAEGTDNASQIAHFSRHGMPAALAEQMQQRKNHYPSLVPALPPAFQRLHDGQQLQIGAHVWQVICSAGHSPEHVALYQPELKVLISGDMILPRISTNISVFALEPDGNPLQRYLEALDRFAALPADTLVLPSHGKPFYGLQARIAALQQHHRSRLQEVEDACRSAPRCAAEIVPLMFRRQLDVHQLVFAYGEAIAHLNKLNVDRKLAKTSGTDLIIRYRAL